MRRFLFTSLSALALVATGIVGAIAVGGTGTVDPPPRIAFLANGIVPADALAAGGIAGQLGAPLFTTRAESLNDDARDGIAAYDPELVIVLGGPVAIADSVLTALSAATGLPIVTTTAPTDGIVRVAGGDRFATARAVAGLLAAYDPAYLPVDATALGAIDAATADHADEADHAATADLADEADHATSADDSDTLDGLDSTDFATLAPISHVLKTAVPYEGSSVLYGSYATELQGGSSGGDFWFDVPLHVGDGGVPNLSIPGFDVCLRFAPTGPSFAQLVANDVETSDITGGVGGTFDAAGCTTIAPSAPIVIGPNSRVHIVMFTPADTTIHLTGIRLTATPTSEPVGGPIENIT